MNEHQDEKLPCAICGKCCRKVGSSVETQFLDRGDSVCRYLNEQTNFCKIYQDRPIVCRVEDYYKAYLSDKIKWIDFIEINVKICNEL